MQRADAHLPNSNQSLSSRQAPVGGWGRVRGPARSADSERSVRLQLATRPPQRSQLGLSYSSLRPEVCFFGCLSFVCFLLFFAFVLFVRLRRVPSLPLRNPPLQTLRPRSSSNSFPRWWSNEVSTPTVPFWSHGVSCVSSAPVSYHVLILFRLNKLPITSSCLWKSRDRWAMFSLNDILICFLASVRFLRNPPNLWCS